VQVTVRWTPSCEEFVVAAREVRLLRVEELRSSLAQLLQEHTSVKDALMRHTQKGVRRESTPLRLTAARLYSRMKAAADELTKCLQSLRLANELPQDMKGADAPIDVSAMVKTGQCPWGRVAVHLLPHPLSRFLFLLPVAPNP
jgi:hypothetical protein